MSDQHGQGDASGRLAAQLGMAPLQFVDIFGAGWRPVESVVRQADGTDGTDSAPGADTTSEWFASGDPVQLMLRVFPHGVFLARPEGVWHHGAGGLAYRQRDQIFVEVGGIADLARLRELIDRLVRVRRTTFGYCRCCRKIVGPEMLRDARTCQDCSRTWSETPQKQELSEPLA